MLNVSATNRTRRFAMGQVKALTILAGLGASALESAQLYSMVREAEEKYRNLVEQLPAVTYGSLFDQFHKALYVSPQI